MDGKEALVLEMMNPEITETIVETATAGVLLAGKLVTGVETACAKKSKNNDTPDRRKNEKTVTQNYLVDRIGNSRNMRSGC